jgi:hypothetical protein
VGIDMATKPSIDTHKAEEAESQDLNAAPPQPRQLYPEVNDRFKGAVIWLGLAFVVIVFLVQHFSGYS